MTQIIQMRQSIVERLRARFPGVDIAAHPRASFGPADLTDALRNKAFAVRISFAAVPEDAVWSSNDTDIPTAWAAYLCAKDVSDQDSRETLILTFLPSMIAAVASFDWPSCGDGFEEHKSERIRAAEAFPGDVDGKSVAVWSVSWKQVLTVSPCDNGDDIRPFLTLITRYDIEPADGTIDASDTISLPRTT